ncbi:MAG: type I methionyl aminopeptidase [Eubacteriales bacterium]
MIQVKNSVQLNAMKEAGRITGEALLVARDIIRPGISTLDVDKAIRAYIEKCGATPSFLGYYGFPGSACISINDEVIHGIPNAKRILQEGDIVKVDVGACINGFHGDSARTIPVGKVSEDVLRLIKATRDSFFCGAEQAVAGNRIGDIGSAIENSVKPYGYGVVREFIGHGIGKVVHEEPDVPNYGTPGRGVRLCNGMTLAIEPMINMGTHNVIMLPDGWTVKTADGMLSAHYENTVAITPEGVQILTLIENDF